MGWGERWERGSGWGKHVNPRLIHVNVWQNSLQYMIPLIQVSRTGTSVEKEVDKQLRRAGRGCLCVCKCRDGRGKGGYLLKDTGVFLSYENVLKLITVIVAEHCEYIH